MKKKLLFGITNLTIGGAERVLVDLCNKLVSEYDITIFTIYNNGELLSQLNKDIKIKYLYDLKFTDLNFIQRKLIPLKILLFGKKIYKRYIHDDYDCEISFLEGPITRLFSYNVSNEFNYPKKIVWIHTDISKVFESGIISKIKKKIDQNIYNLYNDLIFVSKDNKESFKKTFPNISDSKMQVIYNYLDEDKIIEKSNDKINDEEKLFPKDIPVFVSVSRLVEQKAIDRYIKVAGRLKKDGYKFRILIVGDGPLKEDLQKDIIKYDLKDNFILLGKYENPYPFIKKADFFCLFSYYEGYGIVLDESKILNKKILITNCASVEAIRTYPYSKVFENSEDGIYLGLKYEIENFDKLNKWNDLDNLDNLDNLDKNIDNTKDNNIVLRNNKYNTIYLNNAENLKRIKDLLNE